MWITKISFLITLATSINIADVRGEEGRILILGGNGFIGSETVELFLRYGYEVTIVNRGSSYWDSKDRIFSRVKSIACDRQEGLTSCSDLLQFVEEVGHFDAVVDFSAYYEHQVKDGAEALKGKTDLYIYISTDSVYDVCKTKLDDSPYAEKDAIRPDSEEERATFQAFTYGDNKLKGEEELIEQREQGGIPYVILRLPDVMGPRDGTHRWWMYQLWLKSSSKLTDRPVTVPEFFVGYQLSMVYSLDVARTVVEVVKKTDVRDEVFNLAWPESMTLKDLLEDIAAELDLENPPQIKTLSRDDPRANVFLYPSGRRGAINVDKAVKMLNWQPTAWKDAVRDTVKFYEEAMKDETFLQQMDEVIQVVETYMMKRNENKTELYKTLEKLYDIDLKHFMINHDEL